MTFSDKPKFRVPQQIATVPMPEWTRHATPDVQRAVALAILEDMIMDRVNGGAPCEGVIVEVDSE